MITARLKTTCLLLFFATLTLLPVVLKGEEARVLPALKDGIVITGPGRFQHDGELKISGKVKLARLTLDLRGPIVVEAGSTFELDEVNLIISDPPGAPNGVSGLRCLGPATVKIKNSAMEPVGSGHPMWGLKGSAEVNNFQTKNSEFHLDHVTATLDRLKIFELEISRGSRVKGNQLDLVFLSTHTGDDDHLEVGDVPTDKTFSANLTLGSGAKAELKNAKAELFLVYVHGGSQVKLNRMGRVQLAMFPQCRGTLKLGTGMMGTATAPVQIPEQSASDCPFRFTLSDVNVDTWDVYASGKADLTFDNSRIDELTLNQDAKITVRHSELFADWLGVAGNAELNVKDSTVGALRLATSRPDLATSQVRLSGKSRSTFSGVRFDCGIVASDEASAEISNPVEPPKYVRRSGKAVVRGAKIEGERN
jgi:hypothetical protein